MRIAVLLGELGFESQRRIISGILERAGTDKGQIYLFTGDAEDYETRFKYEMGEFNIYNLPDFSTFDGAVVVLDTIHNPSAVSSIIARIRAAGIPCVSLNSYVEGFINIRMDSCSGMYDIMDHLISCHGVKSVFHIAGPAGNNDAAERLQALSEACRRYDIPFDESCYARGNYTNKSGFDIITRYLEQKRPLPDAFVAANDLMAVGAMEGLAKAGYRVPQDVIVTGYDNSMYADVQRPGLTTVIRGEKECGAMAYDLLADCVRGGKKPDTTVISGSAVFRGSCGCQDEYQTDAAMLSELYVKRGLRQNDRLHFIKFLMAEATGLRNFQDFLSSAREFIPLINPREMYICIKGDPDEYALELNNMADNISYGHSISDYMDNTSVIVAWKNGQFLPQKLIPTSALLPGEYIGTDRDNFYLFLPLHHQERCFGYVVFANDEGLIINDPFIMIFSLIISGALENVLRQDTMRTIMTRLDKLSSTDELTGVFNRVGAKEKWPGILERAKAQNMMTGVIFVDLDGLKSVNDRLGHEEGDRYIRMVADVMKQLPLADGFVFRFGGDELVIVCNIVSESEITSYAESIRTAIDTYNRKNRSSYRRDVSIGVYISDNPDLDEMIRIADQNMYAEKRKKGRERYAYGN